MNSASKTALKKTLPTLCEVMNLSEVLVDFEAQDIFTNIECQLINVRISCLDLLISLIL